MICLAQIEVLSPRSRQPRRQFRPDERSEHGQSSTRYPYAENEKGRVNMLGDDAGIHKDPRPDNPAHDQHGRVENAELPPDLGFFQGCRLPYDTREPSLRQLRH